MNGFQTFAAAMTQMHAEIVGEKAFQRLLTSENLTGRRLRLLQQIETGVVRLGEATPEEDVTFFESLLDCSVLAIVTGTTAGPFGPPAVSDRSRLGRIRSYRKILEGADDEKVVDWYFALRIRASAEKQFGCALPDLRDDPRFKHKDRSELEKACDFLLPVEGDPDLVECKRLHPHQAVDGNPIEAAASKVAARVPAAVTQLERTAQHLGCPTATKHLLIDISDYFADSREQKSRSGALVRVSGCDESRAREVYDSAPDHLWAGLDRVTFCWRNLVNINGLPYSVVHSAVEMRKTSRAIRQLYDGWTVEWYPWEHSKCHFEIAVSTVARSIPYLVVRYHNICHCSSFLTFGPEETRAS